MDKKYRKNTITFALILLCVSIFGCGILTVQKAEWIKSDLHDELNGMPGYFLNCVEDYYKWGEKEDWHAETHRDSENALGIIPSFYLALNKPYVSSEVGFHSMLKNSKGETIAYYQPYILFEKNINDIKEHDVRVLILGDEFAEEYSDLDYRDSTDLNYYKDEALRALGNCLEYGKGINGTMAGSVKVDGTCDDTFVYLEKLTWYDYGWYNTSYGFIPSKNRTYKGNMSFEDWFDYDYENVNWNLSMNSVRYMDWWNKDYNTEAEGICEQGFEALKEDPNNCFEVFDEGLFTSTVTITSTITDYDDEKEDYVFSCAYVFHPILIAITELASVYVAIMVFAIIAIIIIYIVMRNSYKQQKAAENNRRGLTRGIAHEMKTPLAIARGYLENWEYVDESDKAEISATIIEEIDDMSTMVTDLLELSKLEAKSKEMFIEKVDMYLLTQSVLNKFTHLIEERGLSVTLEPSSTDESRDYTVEADLEMMRTAIFNFISNAVKYADENISVSLKQSSKSVEFIIENDGATIPEDKIDKVWETFYKNDKNNRSNIASSGLGLAITKNILVLHNAEYGCKSGNGKTQFTFEIKRNFKDNK